MIVQSRDGRFYESPVWFSDRWFISISDEVAEFMLKATARMTHNSAQSDAKKILKHAGFKFEITDCRPDSSAFPPTYDGIVKTYRMGVELLGPPPSPTDYREVLSGPRYDLLQFCWLVPWDIETIWSVFNDKDIKQELANFVLCKYVLVPDNNRKEIQKALKNFKKLGKMKLMEAVEEFGSTIVVEKKRSKNAGSKHGEHLETGQGGI